MPEEPAAQEESVEGIFGRLMSRLGYTRPTPSASAPGAGADAVTAPPPPAHAPTPNHNPTPAPDTAIPNMDDIAALITKEIEKRLPTQQATAPAPAPPPPPLDKPPGDTNPAPASLNTPSPLPTDQPFSWETGFDKSLSQEQRAQYIRDHQSEFYPVKNTRRRN